MRRHGTAAMLLVAIGLGQAFAQHTSNDVAEGISSLARAPVRVGGPYLSVIEDRFGEPILVVDYPWITHAKPSIEVSTLTDDPAENPEVRPQYFFNKRFHGQTKIAVYECQDGSARVPTRTAFSEGGVDYEIIGRRNSLGRPSAVVACRTPIEFISEVVDRSFFCLLDPWAINRRLLRLDLPPTRFGSPGKIRVWFLRDDAVVWSEEIDWPGFSQ